MKKKLLKSVSKADFAVNCSASATGGEDFKQNYETEFRPMTLQEVAQFEDLRRPKLHKTEKILMTPYIEKFGLYNFVTFMHYDIYLSYVLCNFFLLQYSVSEENEKLDLYKEYIDYCFFMRSLRFLPDNIKEFLRQFEKRLSTFGSIVSSDRSFYCDDFMLPDTLIVTGYKKTVRADVNGDNKKDLFALSIDDKLYCYNLD